MSAAVIIPFGQAVARLRRRAQERRDQALIAAMEAELDIQPARPLGDLIKRAEARLEREGFR